MKFLNSDYIQLLNKPHLYKWVILRWHNLSSKCCQSLEYLETLLTTRFFQRDTLSLCRSKGCKITVHQTLRDLECTSTPAEQQNIFFKAPALTACNFTALWPTVPLWTDLDPFFNMLSDQETGSILEICFAISKRLHLHS